MNYNKPELEILKFSQDDIVVRSDGLIDNPSTDENQEGGIIIKNPNGGV